MTKFVLLLCFTALCACASENSDSPLPDTGPVADTASPPDDAPDGGSVPDVAAVPDAAPLFCATADCAAPTPVCSELLQRCVQCTSDTDCSTAPLLTCETFGVDSGDPSYECVECVDDSVCGGGTCDLESHTCMP